MNKARGNDEIPSKLFNILKDDVVKVLYFKYASKFEKLSSGHRNGKGQFSFQSQRWAIPKKGNPKECSNYHSIVFNSHVSKFMLKIFQARLLLYVNQEFSDV